MLALSLSDKFCCFGIFVFNFSVFVFTRFLFSHFSFVLVCIIFFVLVLVFVNEFVIFSFSTIFIFVNENHTARGVSVGECSRLCKPSWLLGSYIDLLMVDRVIVQIGCVCIQGEHTEDGEGTGGGHQDVGCRSCK